MNRDRDLQAALDAAAAAMRAVAAVGDPSELCASDVVWKGAAGPATVADLASQVAAVSAIQGVFGRDGRVVAEESLHEVDQVGGDELLRRVGSALGASGACSDIAHIRESLMSAGDSGGAGRFWAIDPLDGTKGYLRGGQFAIAIALVEEGAPVLGVLAMPRLAAGGTESGTGVISVALAGQGAWQSDAIGGSRLPLRCAPWKSAGAVRLAASVERSHSDGDAVTAAIETFAPVRPVRVDSQCKYALVARGDADAYVRLSPDMTYRECIWDHAAGALIAHEAGCEVSDAAGRALDFAAGRRLERNAGIVCAPPALHRTIASALAGTSLG